MVQKESINRLLASCIVMRELYENKKNIYDVILTFILQCINERSLALFSVEDICDGFKQLYEFDIPPAVIEACLKKYHPAIENVDHRYQVMDTTLQLKNVNYKKYRDEVTNDYSFIKDDFYKWLEKNNYRELDEENLNRELCSFFIEGKCSPRYDLLITSYITQNEKSKDLLQIMNRLKEGVILYTGLVTSFIPNESILLEHPLTLYLDTEVLFNLAGYNGEHFKDSFNDLYKLAQEVNSLKESNNGAMINFRYFKEVEEAVNDYFKSAIRTLEKKEPVESYSAMELILQGCRNRADVIEKKAEFLKTLQTMNILPIESDTDSECNQYNLQNDFNYRSSCDPGEQESLKFLSYIYTLRKGNNCRNLSCAKHLFVTGTYIHVKNSINSKILNDDCLPLALFTDDVTKQLWFILDKGFGINDYPKTFDILINAQMFLSTISAPYLTKKFEELVEEFQSHKIDENTLRHRLQEYRKELIEPGYVFYDPVSSPECSEEMKAHVTKLQREAKNHARINTRIKRLEKENLCLKQEIERLKKEYAQEREMFEIERRKYEILFRNTRENEVKTSKQKLRKLKCIRYAAILSAFLLLSLLCIFLWYKLKIFSAIFLFPLIIAIVIDPIKKPIYLMLSKVFTIKVPEHTQEWVDPLD